MVDVDGVNHRRFDVVIIQFSRHCACARVHVRFGSDKLAPIQIWHFFVNDTTKGSAKWRILAVSTMPVTALKRRWSICNRFETWQETGISILLPCKWKTLVFLIGCVRQNFQFKKYQFPYKIKSVENFSLRFSWHDAWQWHSCPSRQLTLSSFL